MKTNEQANISTDAINMQIPNEGNENGGRKEKGSRGTKEAVTGGKAEIPKLDRIKPQNEENPTTVERCFLEQPSS